MYLTNEGHTYYRGTEQCHTKAPFLLLIQDKDTDLGSKNLRALVRKVALQQFGHWMIGTARIKNQSMVVSGAYGSDGLPMSVSKEIYDLGVPVPQDLYDLWNKGGGWNSCGSEATAMREWARKTFNVQGGKKMEKDYVGIDYGMGKTNRDPKTGIHYGVINQNEILQAWADESEPYYIYTCPHCGNELKRGQDAKRCGACYKKIDPDVDFDMLEPFSFFFNSDGYLAECGEDGDIFITKSPFYTTCQYCSPCAPGAGYIMNTVKDGIIAYCFGHDWFEERPTGRLVGCKRCNGRGLLNPNDIPNFNPDKFKENGGHILDPFTVECWVCHGRGEVKEMVQQAPYPVFSVKTGELVEP